MLVIVIYTSFGIVLFSKPCLIQFLKIKVPSRRCLRFYSVAINDFLDLDGNNSNGCYVMFLRIDVDLMLLSGGTLLASRL